MNEYLHKIDRESSEMIEIIIPRLAVERGIDENLKARDMLRWVAEMNNIKVNAEENVLQEVIYQRGRSSMNYGMAISALRLIVATTPQK